MLQLRKCLFFVQNHFTNNFFYKIGVLLFDFTVIWEKEYPINLLKKSSLKTNQALNTKNLPIHQCLFFNSVQFWNSSPKPTLMHKSCNNTNIFWLPNEPSFYYTHCWERKLLQQITTWGVESKEQNTVDSVNKCPLFT